MGTLADRRRTQIMSLLDSQRSLSLEELSAQLGAPEATVRKDLALLAELGLVKPLSDGAAAIPHYRLSRERQEKMELNRERKERIGQMAAGLICAGDSVILDAGTTPLQVASHICSELRLSGDLTVYTSSLRIFREIGSCPGIRMRLLGGIYLHEYESLAGPHTVEILKDIQADKVFLGADGLTLSNGVTTADILEADVDRYMLQASQEVIVVADSSKIGVIGLVTLLQLDQVDRLVTDREAPPDFVETLINLGVDVILA
jgi:DeoR/GlpR family transcriptional regulator of sugar metabolism